MPVRGVLFDSGETLIRPIGGRWNPRFDFESIVLCHEPNLDTALFPTAIAAGQRFLEAASPNGPRVEDYHRTILASLGINDPSASLLADLERPRDTPMVEVFPEVPEVLEALRRRGVAMAIVSDNWPGLERLYARLGLDGYFTTFVISAVLGCTKPDPAMYRAGSEGLGLVPEECLFVDDVPELVEAAIRLGYHGLIARPGSQRPPSHLSAITSLDAVLEAVDWSRGLHR